MVAPSSPSRASDWRFESRLPWPGVRGRRLWQHVTSASDANTNTSTAVDGDADDDPDNDDDDDAYDGPTGTGASSMGLGRRRRPSLAVPSAVRYEVEMCESTAGHIALVLLRRDIAAAAAATPSTSTTTGDAAAAAQLAIPRVLYVVDAVPPKRATSGSSSLSAAAAARSSLQRHAQAEPRWTMLASEARAHSFGGATATSASTSASAEGVATPSLVFSSVPAQQQHVDELALVEELFTTSRATKDACILAKPPLLCARFDCRLVAVQFCRTDRLSAASSSASSPLRCVVAREDGMCYIWEWSADLHTWSFLNRFCFLENPNLKWTRPVLLFSTAPCPAWTTTSTDGSTASSSDAVETMELAWWSSETKDAPRLFVRKIQFGVEKNTFRTEIRIGSAFAVPRACDVVSLRGSSLGLWVVSRTDGVRLRSVATLRTLQLDWTALLSGDDHVATDDHAATTLTCVHGVTGELLVVHRRSGRVVVVAPRKQRDGERTLVHTPLLTIQHEADRDHTDRAAETIESVAVHRQLLLVLRGQRVEVYSVVSGALLASLAVPVGSSGLTLWTSASNAGRAGVTAVGLVGARGYWQLRTPSGHALTALHTTNDALRVARAYGPTLAFDAARLALELLQSARALVGSARATAWDAAVQSLSSPALLLATLARSSSSLSEQRLLDEMAELVAAIYRVTHEVLVTGRFGAAVEKRDDARLLRGLPFVTPASVESLHHLANWVLLAKRKLARLQGAVVHKGARHARARTVSALSTIAGDDADDDDDVNERDVLEDPATAMPALQVHVHVPGSTQSQPHRHTRHDAANDEAAARDEASSSQLSRKLRPMTSLQFAAGSCSTRHGAQWLAQLESLLRPAPAPAPPHALLFHEERSLADFQVALSSFSKHMYFESMARLYLLHAPRKLLAFVRAVAQYAPRLFSLSSDTSGSNDRASGSGTGTARSHAERALTLLPPAQQLVARVKRDAADANAPTTTPTASTTIRPRKRSSSSSLSSVVGQIPETVGRSSDNDSDSDVKTTLLVYAELLVLAGYALEACRVLLDADLYDDCVATLLLPHRVPTANDDSDRGAVKTHTEAVPTAVFFALLEHCVAYRSARELESLLACKPPHVDALLVLRALRQLLPLQVVRDSSAGTVASVGALRKVLLRLVREHGAAARAQSVTALNNAHE